MPVIVTLVTSVSYYDTTKWGVLSPDLPHEFPSVWAHGVCHLNPCHMDAFLIWLLPFITCLCEVEIYNMAKAI